MDNIINTSSKPAEKTTDANGFASKPTAEEQAFLDRLYPGMTQQAREQQAKEDGVDVAMKTAQNASDAPLSEVVGLPAAERVKVRTDFNQTLRESGLDPYLVGVPLWERHVQTRVAEARGNVDEDALAQRIQAGNENIRQEIFTVYGRARGEDLIARANRFTKQFPKLYALLGQGGLGSDPKIVIPIIEHVHRLGWR